MDLDRSIGLAGATAMVVGIIVGASIFVQPSEISRHVPSAGGMLAVWLVAGVLTLAGALVCAELASVFPRTGGVYVFLEQTLAPDFGFLWGWAMFWSVHSGIIAASSVIFGRYVAYFFPLGDGGIRAAAIVAILALSAVNYAGVRQGSRLQTLVTAAKLVAIVLLLALALIFGSRTPQAQTAASAPISPVEFILAINAGLFAFGGWHMVTYSAGETRDARRTIPRALAVGTLAVAFCYLALNGVFLYLLPLDRVVTSERIAADAAAAVAGAKGAAAVSALVILSSLGVLNGVILAGPRLYFAMAEKGMAFRALARIHPRFRTPHVAIVVQAIWSSVLVATGTYRSLFTRVVYTEWLFFALMTIGLLRVHRRAGYRPAYRVPGYPVVPLLFIAASLIAAACQIAANPRDTAVGLLLVMLGWPVYRFWIRSHVHH